MSATDVARLPQVEAPRAPRRAEAITRLVPPIAVAVGLLRLGYLFTAVGADEGGYLAIGRQWDAGSSLYGHYWVDRPPLLITLFRFASWLGGITALRVLGAIAAALLVLGVARLAGQLAGRTAQPVAAAVAGALLLSPQLGTMQVNGELLAAPFLAWGLVLATAALRRPEEVRSRVALAGAAALGVAALLIKQNMAEVAVFVVVAGAVAIGNGSLPRPLIRPLAAAAAAGSAAALLLAGIWTVAHHTSLAGVFDAMYPFRLRAAGQVDLAPDPGQVSRVGRFLTTWLVSGMPVLVAALGWQVLRRRLRGPAVVGLAAVGLYATVSILVSGGFWDHYLVEAILPSAVAAGVLTARAGRRRLFAAASAVVVLLGLHAWGSGLGRPVGDTGTATGAAIGAVARSGDTILSAFGDAETVAASGLSSPYPYLWTLPAQVRDPELRLLDRTLAGPAAPTWIVDWQRPSFSAAAQQRFEAVLRARYRQVATVCGHPVHLLRGLNRPVPVAESCAVTPEEGLPEG